MEWDDPQLKTPKGRKKRERYGKGRMGEKAEPAVNGIKVQHKRMEWQGGEQHFN